jgi:DNA primase
MAIDFPAVRARHRLADVARRTGYPVEADTGEVYVCCPIHAERTPSMLLHLDTGRYHCFGCGRHGDVVQWMRDIYRLGVADAARMLDQPGPFPAPPAGEARREVASAGSRGERPQLDRTSPQRVRAALAAAWAYYSYGALHDAGLAYLAGRGIDVAALEAEVGGPVIGRTPFKTPDQLVAHLQGKRSFSDDELVDAGLARRTPSPLASEPPKLIDAYRRRFVVPVRDDAGRLVGLIGRYDGDAKADGAPKYLNPPRTAVYDKARDLYRPSTPLLARAGQVVVVEGVLDALAIAAAAAQAARSSEFAPVAESGTALSEMQVAKVAAMHPRAPVLAADGDPTGGGANTSWAVALAKAGRESAIVTWPAGEDPASWLAAHGTDGLAAVTRSGCLRAVGTDLRPRHSGPHVAERLIAELAPTARAEDRWRAALTPTTRMGPVAGARYVTAAADVLAPLVVAAAVEASTDGYGPVNDVILTVASYGRRLPEPAQVRYVEEAALEIERSNLAPAGWAQRRVQAEIEGQVDADLARWLTGPPSIRPLD